MLCLETITLILSQFFKLQECGCSTWVFCLRAADRLRSWCWQGPQSSEGWTGEGSASKSTQAIVGGSPLLVSCRAGPSLGSSPCESLHVAAYNTAADFTEQTRREQTTQKSWSFAHTCQKWYTIMSSIYQKQVTRFDAHLIKGIAWGPEYQEVGGTGVISEVACRPPETFLSSPETPCWPLL